jgi:GDP-L-fucose synthase
MDKITGGKLFIAGHRGLVGSGLARAFGADPAYELVLRTRAELDLANADAVKAFYAAEKPELVIVAAAKVGGIKANNDFPVDFLLENLQIQNNLIHGAFEAGVKKLLFLGSSCIYPKLAPQPIREDSLLTGPLEPTNDAYAIAKIAGIRLCQAYHQQYGARFISGMPTNLYGPNDNFHPQHSHVLPALIRRFHEAAEAKLESVTCWGTGTPRREFLHVDDLSAACKLLLETYEKPMEIVNIGCGEDFTIREIAEMIAEVTGYQGRLEWDTTKPDGTPRKLLDVGRLTAAGWTPAIPLKEGLASTYQWFLENPWRG